MGKHERADIELVEKSVANMLMNKPSLVSNNHKWYKHVLAFVNYIKLNYPNYRDVKPIGNKYEKLLGDLKIVMNDNVEHIIELKTSETKKGKGTLANISQNALTKYNLVNSHKGIKLLSWSEFRIENNFSEHVNTLLNQYVGIKGKNTEEKGYFIKKRIKENDIKANLVKNKIMALARKNKLEYLDYISKFKLNQNNIKKFVFCMLNGIHTEKAIKDFFDNTDVSQIKNITNRLVTLYSNEVGGKVKVTNQKNNTKELFDENIVYEIEFIDKSVNVSLYIKAIDIKNNISKKIISFILHWKNCFQGIKTPCINIFRTGEV